MVITSYHNTIFFHSTTSCVLCTEIECAAFKVVYRHNHRGQYNLRALFAAINQFCDCFQLLKVYVDGHQKSKMWIVFCLTTWVRCANISFDRPQRTRWINQSNPHLCLSPELLFEWTKKIYWTNCMGRQTRPWLRNFQKIWLINEFVVFVFGVGFGRNFETI